ncbi:unnamed protein product [Phyllotreta striolata]|uniref:Major facilitator superfamily (MFS) profile domain-containing protein n=1 Tax=Phyllotreta striolata TaxID=444603 RepID=A0A9N9XR85_PHYSR|nr:unnamed protein product [Phyllotreta striolata]
MTESTNIFEGTSPQLIAVLTGTLTAISDGMQYGWTAPVIPILRGPNSPVEVTEQQAEWLEHLLMIGSFCGLWLTMYFVDKIGRKKSILLASFVTTCVWIVIAVAPQVEYIFVARVFAGAASNMAFVATPMYIAEIAEQKIRGFLSSLVYLMMLIGILLIYAVAPYIPFYGHCVMGALLAFLQFCIFPFMPESPYYLLYREHPDEAKNSLRRLRSHETNIDKEFNEIKGAVARQKEEQAKLKAYGMTLADAMYVTASLLSLQIYQRLTTFGLHYPFYIFSACCYIGAVFTYFFIPETKGKTLEQIQMILKGRPIEEAGRIDT